MDTSACIADQDLLHSGTSEDEVRLIRNVIRVVCAEAEWPAFLSQLRRLGPELRDAMIKLYDASPPNRTNQASLCERLEEIGVSDDQVECVYHARRMIRRAISAKRLLLQHDIELSDKALEHWQSGAQSVWMYSFARLILWHLTLEKGSPDAPCLQFAVRLAMDEARNAYAHYATAISTSDQAA